MSTPRTLRSITSSQNDHPPYAVHSNVAFSSQNFAHLFSIQCSYSLLLSVLDQCQPVHRARSESILRVDVLVIHQHLLFFLRISSPMVLNNCIQCWHAVHGRNKRRSRTRMKRGQGETSKIEKDLRWLFVT